MAFLPSNRVSSSSPSAQTGTPVPRTKVAARHRSSSRCLYVTMHMANVSKPPESYVSDDIGDGFMGEGVLSDLDIL